MAQQRGWLSKKSFAHAETTRNFDNWLWNCRLKPLVGLGFHIRITGRWGFIPLSKKRWENHRFSAVSIYHALTILEYDHWDHQWLWMMFHRKFLCNFFFFFFSFHVDTSWNLLASQVWPCYIIGSTKTHSSLRIYTYYGPVGGCLILVARIRRAQ